MLDFSNKAPSNFKWDKINYTKLNLDNLDPDDRTLTDESAGLIQQPRPNHPIEGVLGIVSEALSPAA